MKFESLVSFLISYGHLRINYNNKCQIGTCIFEFSPIIPLSSAQSYYSGISLKGLPEICTKDN